MKKKKQEKREGDKKLSHPDRKRKLLILCFTR